MNELAFSPAAALVAVRAAAGAAALAPVVDGWLGNRRLSEHTRAAYRRDVLAWVDWCTQRGLDLLTVSFLDVNAYARELEADDRPGGAYAAATVDRKLSAVSSWYDFLARLGALPRNPVDGADRPPVDRDHSRTVGLSAREVAALKREADLDPYPSRHRTRALIRFLVDLGARVAEATGATIGDLGYENNWRTVRLRLKGGKRRVRRIPPELGAALDAMLRTRAAAAGVPVDQLDPGAPLFATDAGRRLDRADVFRLVRRLAHRASIPSASRLSPHSLRHAFATIARDDGVALEDVQDAMAHADPRTTRRYDRDRGALRRDPSVRVADATAPEQLAEDPAGWPGQPV